VRYRADIDELEERVALLKDVAERMVIPVEAVPEDPNGAR
jgi:hypothetical protein